MEFSAYSFLFEDEEALISDVSSPLSVSDTSLVLPSGASYSDLTKEFTLSPSTAFVAGENVIGEVHYYYADNYVGSADIIFHSDGDIIVVPSPTPTLYPAPEQTGNGYDFSKDSAQVSNNADTTDEEPDKRPMIIGIIVGSVVLAAGLYIVLVEVPYHKKKKAYQKKYGRGSL